MQRSRSSVRSKARAGRCVGRRIAQPAHQPVAIMGFEIGDGATLRSASGGAAWGIAVRFVQRRAHHDAAALGALAGDDDGVRAHLGAHLAKAPRFMSLARNVRSCMARQTCPMRAQAAPIAWISFCDITTVCGRKRSMIERTKGRICGLVSSTGTSSLLLASSKRSRTHLDELLKLRRRHGELAVFALADDRFLRRPAPRRATARRAADSRRAQDWRWQSWRARRARTCSVM